MKTFDSETSTPTLTVATVNNVFASNFEFRYTIPDNPKSGSVKMLIIPVDSGEDSNGVRTIVFSNELEQQQLAETLPVTMNLLSILATDSTAVVSVTPATDLVDGASYNVTFQYQDDVGNIPASATSANLVYDGITIAPILIKPATGVLGTTRMPINFNLTYSLPETPKNGSVTINIVPIIYSGETNDNCSLTDTSISRDLVLATDSAGTVSQVFPCVGKSRVVIFSHDTIAEMQFD